MFAALAASLLLQEPAAIVARLASEEIAEREQAATVLAILGQRAIPVLLDALHNADAEVASQAHDIIARLLPTLPDELTTRDKQLRTMKEARETRSLIEELKRESLFVYVASPNFRAYDPSPRYARLAELGDRGLAALLQVAQDPSLAADPRIVAVRVLARIGDIRAVGPLIRLLACRALGGSPSPDTLGSAASSALSRFPDSCAIPRLIDALHASMDAEPITRHLRTRTGRNIEGDASAWNAWWQVRHRLRCRESAEAQATRRITPSIQASREFQGADRRAKERAAHLQMRGSVLRL